MFDIFSQSTGRTLFTTRFECVARLVTYLCRSLDYAVRGEGWATPDTTDDERREFCAVYTPEDGFKWIDDDSDERFAWARPEACEIDIESIQWDR